MRALALCLLLGMASAGVTAADTRSGDLDGVWEGVVEAPARPLVVAVDFGAGTAKVDVTGSAALAVEGLASADCRVRFRIAAGGRALAFDGARSGTRIRGTVHVDEADVPFWLERLPALPAPRDRVEAWQQDLDAMLTRFLRYDRSFSPRARAAFRDRIARLRRSLRSRSDQEVLVELARAVALAGNAHTRLYLLRNRTEVRQLPIRVWWFRDRLHVVRATAEHRDLVGCRILKIGSMDAAAAAARVRGIDAGNDSWQRYMSAYFLTSPDVLFGAGVVKSAEEVVLTVSDGGRRREVRLAPLPLRKTTAPVEAWRDLAPAYRDVGEWVSALGAGDAPLYLRRPETNYWFEYLPERRVVYLQYNRSQEAPEGPTVRELSDALVREVEERKPEAIVVDLRFNTGGNLQVATPLMKTVAERLGGLPVYVVTGRATFSAGLSHVAQLRQWARATLVGEPPGEGLEYWSEGGNLLLPNSKVTAHYANAFHAYSKREYPDRRPYYLDLDVDSIAPDVLVDSTWADYIHGRDPAMDAIAARLRASERSRDGRTDRSPRDRRR
jgi:hypothetical protein